MPSSCKQLEGTQLATWKTIAIFKISFLFSIAQAAKIKWKMKMWLLDRKCWIMHKRKRRRERPAVFVRFIRLGNVQSPTKKRNVQLEKREPPSFILLLLAVLLLLVMYVSLPNKATALAIGRQRKKFTLSTRWVRSFFLLLLFLLWYYFFSSPGVVVVFLWTAIHQGQWWCFFVHVSLVQIWRHAENLQVRCLGFFFSTRLLFSI